MRRHCGAGAGAAVTALALKARTGRTTFWVLSTGWRPCLSRAVLLSPSIYCHSVRHSRLASERRPIRAARLRAALRTHSGKWRLLRGARGHRRGTESSVGRPPRLTFCRSRMGDLVMDAAAWRGSGPEVSGVGGTAAVRQWLGMEGLHGTPWWWSWWRLTVAKIAGPVRVEGARSCGVAGRARSSRDRPGACRRDLASDERADGAWPRTAAEHWPDPGWVVQQHRGGGWTLLRRWWRRSRFAVVEVAARTFASLRSCRCRSAEQPSLAAWWWIVSSQISRRGEASGGDSRELVLGLVGQRVLACTSCWSSGHGGGDRPAAVS